MPIVSLVPKSMKMTVINLVNQCSMDFQLDISSVWRKRLGSHTCSLRVDGENIVEEDYVERGSLSNRIASILMRLFNVNPLYAQELELPSRIKAFAVDPTSENQVHWGVVQIVSEVARIPVNEVTDEFNVKNAAMLNELKQIIIVENLQSQFNIDIPDEHWNGLNTIKPITNYIIARIRMKNYFEALGMPNINTYRQMIQSLPNYEQPKFVPLQ